jgi:hypothetical protein
MSKLINELLNEFIPFEYDRKLLEEAVKSNPTGTLTIKAILQRADAENQNGRIYPREILNREVERYNDEFVKQRRAFGELDHPEATVVELKNASHIVTEMHWEGTDLIGTLEILTTPSGNIVRELLRNGCRIGISSRGVGSVIPTNGDKVMVDEDFNLICFDIVSNPSTHGAFLLENAQGRLARVKSDRINTLVMDFFSQITSGRPGDR